MALAAALACAGTAAPAAAHESEQYTLPVGREFADLGPHFSRLVHAAIAAAVTQVNDAIADAADPAGERSAVLAGSRLTVAELQAPGTIAERVWSHLFAAMPTNELLDLDLQSPALQARYPGLTTLHRPGRAIYDDPLLVVDITKFVRTFFRAGTIDIGGTLVGTDKLIHFVNVGRIYHAAYLDRLAEGLTAEAAVQAAIEATSRNPLTSEDYLLGGYTTGIVSNGDLAADFAGLAFYRNLTEALPWDGRLRPPVLERDGLGWRLAVAPDSDFFTAFVLPHWNEVLNPSRYASYFAWRVRALIAERCADAIDHYRDAHGRRRDGAQFAALERALGTVHGTPYDHRAQPTQAVSLAALCFEAPAAAEAEAVLDADLQRDALWWAAHDGDLGAVRWLLAAGAAPATADADGETPLHVATRRGHTAVVQALLAAGAPADARGAYGATPLMVAAAHAQPATAMLLLQAGADPNARGLFGQGALHEAVLRGSPRLARLLLEHGADPQLADGAGRRPQQLAQRAGDEPVLRVLATGAGTTRQAGAGRVAPRTPAADPAAPGDEARAAVDGPLLAAAPPAVTATPSPPDAPASR